MRDREQKSSQDADRVITGGVRRQLVSAPSKRAILISGIGVLLVGLSALMVWLYFVQGSKQSSDTEGSAEQELIIPDYLKEFSAEADENHESVVREQAKLYTEEFEREFGGEIKIESHEQLQSYIYVANAYVDAGNIPRAIEIYELIIEQQDRSFSELNEQEQGLSADFIEVLKSTVADLRKELNDS